MKMFEIAVGRSRRSRQHLRRRSCAGVSTTRSARSFLSRVRTGTEGGGDRVSGAVCRGLRVSAVAVLAFSLTACGSGLSGLADDLSDSLKAAQAAVSTETLAFQMLDRHRSTDAIAETAMTDMAKDLSSEEKSINEVDVSSPAAQQLRDLALAATQSAGSASLAARDCLATKTPCGPARQQLEAASRQLTSALARVKAMQ
jgi:hypothetical protein